jgi:hypothetical protein
MKRTLIFASSVVLLLVAGFAIVEAQSDTASEAKSARQAQQEARQQRRAERIAEYEHYVDSVVMSHNYRFVPQTMQQLPAGIMRNLQNPNYEIIVWSDAVDVCIPYLKGYTPPYYFVVFNYVLSSVQGYTVEQTHEGWHVTFQSTMFSATTYTFSLDIYSHYGGATLTISSPFYNSVQYTGNIFGI